MIRFWVFLFTCIPLVLPGKDIPISIFPQVSRTGKLTAVSSPEPIHSFYSPMPAPKYSPRLTMVQSGKILLSWIDPRSGHYTIMGESFSPETFFFEPEFILPNTHSVTLFKYDLASNANGVSVLALAKNDSLYVQFFYNQTFQVPTQWRIRQQTWDQLNVAINPNNKAVIFSTFDIIFKHLFMVDSTGIKELPFHFLASWISDQAITSNQTGRFFIVSAERNESKLYLGKISPNGDSMVFYPIRDRIRYDPQAKIVTTTDGTPFITWWEGDYITAFRLMGTPFNDSDNSFRSPFQISPVGQDPRGALPYALTALPDTTVLVVIGKGKTLWFRHFSRDGRLLSTDIDTLDVAEAFGNISLIRMPDQSTFSVPIIIKGSQDYSFQFLRYELPNQSLTNFHYVIPDSFGAFQVDPRVYRSPTGSVLPVWKDYRSGHLEYRSALPIPMELNERTLLPATPQMNIETIAGNRDGDFFIVYSALTQHNRTFIWQKITRNPFHISPPETIYQNTTGRFIRFKYFENNYLLSVRWGSWNEVVTGLHRRSYSYLFQNVYKLRDYDYIVQQCALNRQGHVGIFARTYSRYKKPYLFQFITYLGKTLTPEIYFTLPDDFQIDSTLSAVLDEAGNFTVLVRLYSSTKVLSPKEDIYALLYLTPDRGILAAFPSSTIPQLKLLKDHLVGVFASQKNKIYLYLLNEAFDIWKRYEVADFSGNYFQRGYAADGYLQNEELVIYYESPTVPNTGLDILKQKFELPEIGKLIPKTPLPIVNKDAVVRLFPNPARNNVEVVVHLQFLNNITLELFNIRGQRVKTVFQGILKPGNTVLNFSVADLPSGVYFLRLKAFDTSVKKLVVLK